MATDTEAKQQEKLAIIATRAAAFDRSPFWFTVWDVTKKVLEVTCWLGWTLLVAQCTCNGCVF